MGWITLLVFGAIGFVLIHFVQKRDLLDLLLLNSSVWQQVLIGTLLGVLITQLISIVVDIPWFYESKKHFVDLIGPVGLSLPAIVFVSFCAGFGEELFFRGALQYWLGIWITAILFVVLHGYIHLKDLKLSIYGAMLIIGSACFGYMADYIGLLSAMVAHTIYDIIMFIKIKKSYASNSHRAYES